MLQNIFRLVYIENAQIELVDKGSIADNVQRYPLKRLVLDELEVQLDSHGFVGRHCKGAGVNLHAQVRAAISPQFYLGGKHLGGLFVGDVQCLIQVFFVKLVDPIPRGVQQLGLGDVSLDFVKNSVVDHARETDVLWVAHA